MGVKLPKPVTLFIRRTLKSYDKKLKEGNGVYCDNYKIIIIIIGKSVGVNGDSGSASVKAAEPIKGT